MRYGPRVAIRPEVHRLLKEIALREQVAIAVVVERAILRYSMEDAEVE
ncbi:MAG: hypothetical protein ACP5RH_11050 [Leptodesmis sp.]